MLLINIRFRMIRKRERKDKLFSFGYVVLRFFWELNWKVYCGERRVM